MNALFKKNPALFTKFQGQLSPPSETVMEDARCLSFLPLRNGHKVFVLMTLRIWKTANQVSLQTPSIINEDNAISAPISSIPPVCTNVLQVNTNDSPTVALARNSLEELQKTIFQLAKEFLN